MSEPERPSEKGGKVIQFRAGPQPKPDAAPSVPVTAEIEVLPSSIYKPGVPIENAPEGFHETFPLRGPMHTYAWWASQVTDAPAWFHAASILVAATAEIARRGWVIGAEQRYLPRLWMAMVAGPGIGKSTAINLARDFYTDAGGAGGWKSPYVTAEGSTQGLFEAIAKLRDDKTNLTTAVLVKEEFSTLLSGKRRDDLSFALCEWADGQHHERHTRQLQRARAEGGPGGEDRITNAAISATFVTTKHALLDVATAQHLHGGLFSRFLWVPGQGSDVTPRLHPGRAAVERATAVGAWKRWHGWLDAEEMANPQKVLPIKSEVNDYLEQTLFVDYKRALQENNLMTAHYKRALTHASIIAGVFALNDGFHAVEPIHMHRAVNFLNLCLDNISRFAPDVATTGLMRAINQAFDIVQSKGDKGARRTDFYRDLHVTKRELDTILETLIDEGAISEEIIVRTGKPGRPTSRYIAQNETRFTPDLDDPEAIA